MRLFNIKTALTAIASTLFALCLSHTAQANGLFGDFNYDMIVDIADADLMTGEIAAGTNAVAFDLTDDGVVDLGDLDSWFSYYSTFSGVPLAIALVDVDFSGSNTAWDYHIIQSNLLSSSSSFSDGDLNASGLVDTVDLNLYISRGGVVPEPSTVSVLLLGGLLARRRRALKR